MAELFELSNEVREETKDELKKHICTVHIGNALSLLSRKTFNVMLNNAVLKFDKDNYGQKHEIDLNKLKLLTGFTSHNTAALLKQIRLLKNTSIEWIKNAEDELSDFESCSFFSYIAKVGDKIQYRYAPELEEKLDNPNVYARLDLLSIRLFSSSYSVALYENLSRYRPNKKTKFAGQSPHWEIEKFRQLMGLGNSNSYKKFADFRKRVINVAVKEINESSDLKVEVKFTKSGCKITHIKFDIKDNQQGCLDLMIDSEKADHIKCCIELIEDYGVAKKQVEEWLLLYGEERLEEVLLMTKAKEMEEKIKNPPAYIATIINNKWTNDKLVEAYLAGIEAEKRKTERAKKKHADDLTKESVVKQSDKEFAKENADRETKVNAYLKALTASQKKKFLGGINFGISDTEGSFLWYHSVELAIDEAEEK